ncbi:DNA polymerase IV [Amycolatopsis sp. NPDC004625]|uniref:DNA polymerase IV n=1 Tax=Amycolatopsis sp. NPDC004625 TaxID=3154670 RepID=UPI0033A12DB7
MTDEGPILHADLDSFYASVEQRDDPALKGRPVIVGGGVVLAASYEAKAYGVRTAMGGTQARRLCPHAVVVPPRMSAYMAASRAVFDVFHDTTPWVEGISVDEAFLDVGGLGRIAGRPSRIAERLRTAVAERTGLPITVGVARTKFLAKVASRVAKPDGLLVVPHDRELEFLHPLPVSALWGVGKITAEKLRLRGITTVGQLAASEQVDLVGLLGRVAGAHLHDLAHNEDPRRVELGVRRRSIGAQRALGRGRRTPAELDVVLVALIDRIARRLRAARRVCRTVTIRLRFADFSRATRSHTLTDPTAGTGVLLAAARELLVAALPLIADRGLTLLGAALSNLADENPFQPTLPFERERATELDTALDAVRDRFGKAAVTRAVLLGRPDDLEVPLLPD